MTGFDSGRRGLLRWIGAAGLTLGATPALASQSEKLSAIDPRIGARDFTLNDLDGTAHTLSQYRGRVVVVTFWATWCPPCRFEIPSLQRFWQATQEEGIVTQAIHVGGNEDTVTLFAMDHGAEFPILMDPKSETIGNWPVSALPATIIVDPAGNMALKAVGSREWDDPEIIAQIRALKRKD